MKQAFTLFLFIIALQFSVFADQTSTADNNTISPNPANTSFTISYIYTPGLYLEVYDVLGTVVTRIELLSGMDAIDVDCSNWKKGYYFCKFISNNKVQNALKLVIQH
jgi:hypothetical protein